MPSTGTMINASGGNGVRSISGGTAGLKVCVRYHQRRLRGQPLDAAGRGRQMRGMTPNSTGDPRIRDGGSTVTPAEYARLTGLYVRAVRERIHHGELVTALVRGRHGPEYRIPHPDSTVGHTVDPVVINGEAHSAGTVDPPSLVGLGELVIVLREKDGSPAPPGRAHFHSPLTSYRCARASSAIGW